MALLHLLNVRLSNPNKRLDVTGEIKVASTGNIRVHNVSNSIPVALQVQS